MTIYTKTGDKGQTSVYRGKRVSKSDLQIEAYGSVDELTSFIGLTIAKLMSRSDKRYLTQIQKDLYQIMAYLAGSPQELKDLEHEVKLFEQKIDNIQSKLPKLNRFILPQGSELSTLFHILRAITRRSERSVVRYFYVNQLTIINNPSSIIKYLNRLSDLFFVLARFYSKEKEVLL